MRRILAAFVLVASVLPIPAAAAPSLGTFLTDYHVFEDSGNSMNPALQNGDRFVAERATHLRRGDIAVFHPPGNSDTFYVKRIIGLPGETVTIRDGRVFVRGSGSMRTRALREPYLDDRNRAATYRHPPASGDARPQTYVVPAGRYFLLGDNRQGSLDSRSFTGADGEAQPFVAERDIPWIAMRVTSPRASRKSFGTVRYGF